MSLYVQVFYEDILVGEVLTNHSMSLEDVLESIGFDGVEFLEETGFDDFDYGDFKMAW